MHTLLIYLNLSIHLHDISIHFDLQITLHILDVIQLFVPLAELLESVPLKDLSFNFQNDVLSLLYVLSDHPNFILKILNHFGVILPLSLLDHLIDTNNLVKVGLYVLKEVRHLLFQGTD